MTPAPTEPAFVLTYAPSGNGKTVDCGYSFPAGLFIATRGALQSVRNVCGYEPRVEDAKTIDDVTKRISMLKPGEVDSVVIDDFSFLAEQTISAYEKKFSGFKLWGALRDSTLAFRNAARYASFHVVLNAWEQPPKTKEDGTRARGGPNLPGKLPEQLPAMCDLVLRGSLDPMRKPWPGVYRCQVSSDFVMKDRFHVAQKIDPAPMNLGEIMRAVGYKVARHPDLAWQEEIVETVAQQILAVSPAEMPNIVNGVYKSLLTNGASPEAARWTMRDGVDRAVIRRSIAARNDAFFV